MGIYNVSIDNATVKEIAEQMQEHHITTGIDGKLTLGLLIGDAYGKIWQSHSEGKYPDAEIILNAFTRAEGLYKIVLGVVGYVGDDKIKGIPPQVDFLTNDLWNMVNTKINPIPGLNREDVWQKEMPYVAMAVNQNGVYQMKVDVVS